MDALEVNQFRGGGVPWDLGAVAEWTANLCSPDAGCSVQRDCAGGAERSTLRTQEQVEAYFDLNEPSSMSGIDDSERVVQAQQMREVSCTNGGIDLNVGAGSELFDCNSGLLDEGIEDRQNESTSEVCNRREDCSSVCVDSVFNDGVSGIQPPDAQLTQSWEKRPRLGHIPDEQEETTENPTALEKALKGFVIRKHGLVVQPSVGMHFDSMAEAFEFYNLYSWEVGFGIRYDRSRRNSERTKTIQDIVCICSGKPNKGTTSTLRCRCPAKMRIARSKDGGWHVKEHVADHNHHLSDTFAEKQQWRSHRHIDLHTKQLIKHLRDNNVNMTKVFSIISSFFGTAGSAPFTKRSIRTLCAKLARDNDDDDIGKTMEVFSKIKEEDPDFTYSVELDDECRIKTIIWTNGRSRRHYACFGDVITFDTTYKTNLYDMPFGLFVGINNHFQSIVLGGVLMRNESIKSFKWIFSEFVRLMGGKHPVTILTDQSKAMEAAIKEVFPNTTHRWCRWHVLRKAREHLGEIYSRRSGFKEEFHKIINSMLTVEEFELAWHHMLVKYNLEKNAFLAQIFANREKWAKPYFKGKFCAGQTSTQRSESGNSMLKRYVGRSCPMHQFVQMYQQLQFDREQEESRQEQASRLGGRIIKYNIPIESHAAQIYTRNMFDKFCDLIFESGYFIASEIIPQMKYKVRHIRAEKREKWEKVEFNIDVTCNGEQYICECGLPEHMGMLCPHIIRVLIQFGVDEIPRKHIVKRWTLNARDVLPPHLEHYQKERAALHSQTLRHSGLYVAALEVVNLGDSNVKAYEVAMKYLLQAKAELQELAAEKDGLALTDQLVVQAASRNATEGDVCHADAEHQLIANGTVHKVLPPQASRKRGRPSVARDKPPYEHRQKRHKYYHTEQMLQLTETTQAGIVTDQPSSRRRITRCSRCNLLGHTKNACKAPPLSEFPSLNGAMWLGDSYVDV